MNPRHISDLSIDNNRCLRRLNKFWVSKNLHLLVIKKWHDQIATGHPGYQKTISFIA